MFAIGHPLFCLCKSVRLLVEHRLNYGLRHTCYANTQSVAAHVEDFGEYIVHLLILLLAFILASIAYVWSLRAPREKWELLRKLSNGRLGLYKRRKHVKFGKFERAFATYAIMSDDAPGRARSFVWRIDRIDRGGRCVGLRNTINTSGQSHLYEIGFAPPLGLYIVYTGEEDHLSYPEREQHLLLLYKETSLSHKEWREDPAFAIRRTLSKWRTALFVFVATSAMGTAFVPVEVVAPQVVVWSLIGMMSLGLLVGIACMLKVQRSVLWVQASGAAFLAACIVGICVLPLVLLGTNGLSFVPLCEGSVMVERSWIEGAGAGESVVHYADVPLPASCQFNAQKTEVSIALYNEFQSGRRVVDVVVSEGILGYKRIKLIGT